MSCSKAAVMLIRRARSAARGRNGICPAALNASKMRLAIHATPTEWVKRVCSAP
jgi:hypothetical protein